MERNAGRWTARNRSTSCAGGAGGNRTRVRKSSTGRSTCLAGLFGFNPVLGQSAGLHVASHLGSRSASSDPKRVRSSVNGVANRGRFLPFDPTQRQVGATSSRSYAARAKRSSLAFTWFPVGFRSSLALRMPCICFLTHVETRSAPGTGLYSRRRASRSIVTMAPCVGLSPQREVHPAGGALVVDAFRVEFRRHEEHAARRHLARVLEVVTHDIRASFGEPARVVVVELDVRQ